MSHFDSLDIELQFLSTKNTINNEDFLNKSFEEVQSEYSKKDDDFETQLNKLFYIPESLNPEILESENVNIAQKNTPNASPNNVTQKNVLYILETKKELKQKSFLGRKKKNSGEIGEHTKNSEDNMIRKFKPRLKNALKDLINSRIKENIRFPDNIINGQKYKTIEILDINQKQAKDTSVEMNRELLQKTIKDFFSVDISGNYSNYPKNFNEILIKELYKKEKGEKITCILEKTVLESLKYFRKDEDVINDPNYSCFKGLEKSFEDFKQELLIKNNEKYTNNMIYLIENFENIYYNKRSRAKRSKKDL
jgi:hypothetical protein